MTAAGCDVDDCAGRLLDPRQKLHEHIRVGGRPPVLRITSVEVQDRRPGLGGSDRIARDLVWRQRQVRAHRRGMDRTRNGAGYDDLATKSHPLPPLSGHDSKRPAEGCRLELCSDERPDLRVSLVLPPTAMKHPIMADFELEEVGLFSRSDTAAKLMRRDGLTRCADIVPLALDRH